MPGRDTQISVLIADSQRLLSEALAAALRKREGLRVIAEQPDTAEGAVKAAKQYRPDVVVCDFWLDGPATTAAILAALPRCKIIHTSWVISSDHISAALEAGAAGFLPQGAGLRDVEEAVRAAGTRSDALVLASQLARLHETISRRSEQTARWGQAFEKLTPRQRQILYMLGNGMLIQEISKDLGIAPVTVKWHIGQILAATGTGSQAEVLAVARYAGIIPT